MEEENRHDCVEREIFPSSSLVQAIRTVVVLVCESSLSRAALGGYD